MGGGPGFRSRDVRLGGVRRAMEAARAEFFAVEGSKNPFFRLRGQGCGIISVMQIIIYITLRFMITMSPTRYARGGSKIH